ncbi:MAG: hypothetical protein K0Q47_51 [Sedimentibacter sp.]|jgi:hypothetical protein|nr:hypothetical protein [Sedimentibacter sp.]
MTRKEIEKFALGHPFPTDYVEILLKKYNYDKGIVRKILCGPSEDVIKEVQSIIKDK